MLQKENIWESCFSVLLTKIKGLGK
jgi:hypothetical protein